MRSGQIVEIEALSHQGLTTNKDPEKFFTAYGIPRMKFWPTPKRFTPK